MENMAAHTTVICNDEVLSFDAVLNLEEELAGRPLSETVYLNLEDVVGVTVAGLARLTAVRASLLAKGRDMRIIYPRQDSSGRKPAA